MNGGIYNIAFRMGVLFDVLLFTILNVLSFTAAGNNFMNGRREEMNFGPHDGVPWGFPFRWNEKLFNVIEGGGAILNIFITVLGGFIFGFMFKFIWSKISSRRVELK